ncbi:Putative phospholipase B-like 2,Putative phospholipase B-like 3,Phospholipase B-like protein B,Phospholipase B-like 1 [Acanthosepion pharaonis]|uniref:Phospholipase B-like 2,Putative phospholipase B-like 3,Phospholipase B-like protein B,Phospholipase B-like 1 n=1 Tax=Acanthosepion pharaonis TaxID=158019 RepID=A0A812BAZ0_ACAPH|nr:Putative phospholipase B-like 2,Putative phospholipase B-like 3,Phospholipase B-like protein B,Phospholipase B-like 1 [Sepia pharaonis]
MSNKDPFWHMVNMYLQQLKGLQDGFYKKRVGLQMLDLYWLQFASDLSDISLALDLPEKKPIRGGSCSAMIKLLNDNKDLYVAHDTWNHYSSMLRIIKSYDFAFHILPNAKYVIPGRKISFSSYPGLLYSGDDYYLLSSGMASLETTIENNNKEIAKRNTLATECVLEGVRAMVANRIATNGPQWAKIFSAYNSGTMQDAYSPFSLFSSFIFLHFFPFSLMLSFFSFCLSIFLFFTFLFTLSFCLHKFLHSLAFPLLFSCFLFSPNFPSLFLFSFHIFLFSSFSFTLSFLFFFFHTCFSPHFPSLFFLFSSYALFSLFFFRSFSFLFNTFSFTFFFPLMCFSSISFSLSLCLLFFHAFFHPQIFLHSLSSSSTFSFFLIFLSFFLFSPFTFMLSFFPKFFFTLSLLLSSFFFHPFSFSLMLSFFPKFSSLSLFSFYAFLFLYISFHAFIFLLFFPCTLSLFTPSLFCSFCFFHSFKSFVVFFLSLFLFPQLLSLCFYLLIPLTFLFFSHHFSFCFFSLLSFIFLVKRHFQFYYRFISFSFFLFSSFPFLFFSHSFFLLFFNFFYLLIYFLSFFPSYTFHSFSFSFFSLPCPFFSFFLFPFPFFLLTLSLSLSLNSLFISSFLSLYNNQWMVVDYNLFTPGRTLPDEGLLIVLEQLPGYIKYEDLTPILKEQRYWGSYNTPYFPEVIKLSKQQDMINQYGDLFTYKNAPRAKIMRRDQGNVTDMKSMIKLMRYNDFTHDPLSKCNCTPQGNAELAISARSDLNPANGSYPQNFLGHRPHGGTDMKLTNSSLARNLQFVAIAGPTYDQVAPFQWSKSDFKNTVSHIGHPDLFQFGPYIFGDDVTKFE